MLFFRGGRPTDALPSAARRTKRFIQCTHARAHACVRSSLTVMPLASFLRTFALALGGPATGDAFAPSNPPRSEGAQPQSACSPPSPCKATSLATFTLIAEIGILLAAACSLNSPSLPRALDASWPTEHASSYASCGRQKARLQGATKWSSNAPRAMKWCAPTTTSSPGEDARRYVLAWRLTEEVVWGGIWESSMFCERGGSAAAGAKATFRKRLQRHVCPYCHTVR